MDLKEPEGQLELGLLALAGAIAIGLGLLISGKTSEGVRRRRREAGQPPPRGSMGPESHRNIAGAAAR